MNGFPASHSCIYENVSQGAAMKQTRSIGTSVGVTALTLFDKSNLCAVAPLSAVFQENSS
jgi:hypothetical protein